MADDVDVLLEQAIRSLLNARTGTICPSDAARAAGTAATWRSLMEPARRAAGRLVAAGELDITQGGEVVDLATVKGPIRIRRRSS